MKKALEWKCNMSVAGLVFAGISALVSAAGAGASAAGRTRAEKKMAEEQRKLTREGLEQDKFQFGFSQLASQRRDSEQRAMRSVFGDQLLKVLNKGAPGISTF
jgi:hypothetical protein